MDFLKRHNLSDPVCLYKWGWSTVRLFLGTTNSCHRVDSDRITPETYADFHNTPAKMADRTKMLNGQWPGRGCEYCKNLEAVGAESDRLQLNNDDRSERLSPINTSKTNVKLIPTIVEVYFNNLCNMGCIYCSSDYSTVWEVEDKKFGLKSELDIKELERGRAEYPAMLAAHWQWLKDNCHGIKEYNILGGEPFFQLELEANIDFFENNPCPDLHFTVLSNLKVDKNKFKRMLDKIQQLLDKKHIKSFELVCSLDCWGPQAEYIRNGLNISKWEENFNILLNDYPKFELHIHSVLMSLTLDTLPDLIGKLNQWNVLRPVSHSINFVEGKPEMMPGIFPKGYFAKQFDLAVDLSTVEGEKNRLRGFERLIDSSESSPELVAKLKQTLDEFDIRRATNWRTLWPWLDQYKD